MITADRIKHYKGHPYFRATAKEVMPNNHSCDDTPRWFAYTPDRQRMIVGGVATEALCKSIIAGATAPHA